MKILQITAHYSPNIGGVETHLEDLVSALATRKHKIFVLTYQPLQTKVEWKIFERKDNIKILRIPWISGFFYKLINKPVLEFLYLVPGIFLAAPFVILFTRPKVLHGHGLIAGVVAIVWGKVFRVRSVISIHNIYHFPSSGLYRRFIDWMFNNVDHVLCLSSQSAIEIRNIVKDKNRVSIFTQWVNLEKFKPLKPKTKKFIVLFVGRLVKEKGIQELLAASEKWDKSIQLQVAGTGPLADLVPEKNYLGPISQERLPEIYSQASLTIVPSIHEEGFGRVILESLACGTAVIGSKRGAIPEAMNNTVGKLIDITPINIKNSIEYFYKNPDKLKKLSKNARNFAEKRYGSSNVEKIISSYINSR